MDCIETWIKMHSTYSWAVFDGKSLKWWIGMIPIYVASLTLVLTKNKISPKQQSSLFM